MTEICRYRKSLCCEYASICILFALFFMLFCNIFLFSERKSLAGVGAQYDSELVYHNVRKEVEEQGVVYTDMESALTGPYADMVRKHFMKLVKPTDHKFAALHGAVWSGGSFVYVPPHVSVEIPLQSYFRLNAPGAGQFEHTLIIVDEGADNRVKLQFAQNLLIEAQGILKESQPLAIFRYVPVWR